MQSVNTADARLRTAISSSSSLRSPKARHHPSLGSPLHITHSGSLRQAKSPRGGDFFFVPTDPVLPASKERESALNGVSRTKRQVTVRWIKNDGQNNSKGRDSIAGGDMDSEHAIHLVPNKGHKPLPLRSPVTKNSQLFFAFQECKKLGVMEAFKAAMGDSGNVVKLNIRVTLDDTEM